MSPRQTRPLLTLLAASALALILLSLSVLPALGQPTFTDVPASHPYYAAITDLAARGIAQGYQVGDTWEFRPESSVFRAQFAKVVCGVMGLSVVEDDWPDPTVPFTDLGEDILPGPQVVNSLYPHEYVAVAYQHAITKGQTETTFAPYAGITRAQTVTMIVRAALNLRSGVLLTPPAAYTGSVPGVGAPHGENLRIAEYNGLLVGLVGFGPSWDPWTSATRGETSQVLHNLLGKLGPVTTTTTAPTTTTTTVALNTTTTMPATTTTTESPGKDLLHFSWSLIQDWQVENVSEQAGVKVERPLAGWNQTFGVLQAMPDQLFALDAVDDEVLYFWSVSDPDGWDVEPLSPRLGGRLLVQICPIQVFSSLFKHVVAREPDGTVLEFMFDPGSDPDVENVTQLTGKRLPGGIAAWIDDQDWAAVTLHVAGVDSNGRVWLFSRPWSGDFSFWLAEDLSASTGCYLAPGTVVGYMGWGGRQYIAGIGRDLPGYHGGVGHLLLLEKYPGVSGWSCRDLGDASGQGIDSVGGMWSTGSEQESNLTDHLVAVTEEGHLLHFAEPMTALVGDSWAGHDVTASTGLIVVSCRPGVARSLGPSAFLNRVWAVTPAGELVVFSAATPGNAWQDVNITQLTGESVDRPLVYWWSYEGNMQVEHVAAAAR